MPHNPTFYVIKDRDEGQALFCLVTYQATVSPKFTIFSKKHFEVPDCLRRKDKPCFEWVTGEMPRSSPALCPHFGLWSPHPYLTAPNPILGPCNSTHRKILNHSTSSGCVLVSRSVIRNYPSPPWWPGVLVTFVSLLGQNTQGPKLGKEGFI